MEKGLFNNILLGTVPAHMSCIVGPGQHPHLDNAEHIHMGYSHLQLSDNNTLAAGTRPVAEHHRMSVVSLQRKDIP
jgi:hypothetical protein